MVQKLVLIACICLGLTVAPAISDAQVPEGFTDHGVAAPVGMSVWGGPVPAIDGEGRRVILVKLWAGLGPQRTTYLLVDAETGASRQIDPKLPGSGAFSIFLSPDNKLYDAIDDQFIEFDPVTEEVHRVGTIPGRMPMSFTIDDDGVIYAGMYPNSEIVAFNPQTRELINHGPLAEEDWPQYPSVAVDDSGWVYATIHHQLGNIVGLNPRTGERRLLYPEERRAYTDRAIAWRGTDGAVYAQVGRQGSCFRLHGGEAEELPDRPRVGVAVQRTTVGPHGQWPDGSRFATVDVPNRRATIVDAGEEEPREIEFDYASGGVNIYSLIGAPDGRIVGSTGIPLRVFEFDPQSAGMRDWGLGTHGGHVNQWVRQGDLLYGAVYSCGSLIEYDPTQPFDPAPIHQSVNPSRAHYQADAQNLYGRPHAMLAHPDGDHVLIGGNPYRGMVGGGMLIYSTRTGEGEIIGRERLIEDQAVMAMAALPGGDLVVGTAIHAATGGTTVATEALVYRFDWETRSITQRWTPVSGTTLIRDLLVGPDGLVYGLASPNHLFVLDPDTGEVLHSEEVDDYGSQTGSQAARTLAIGPDGAVLVLYRDAIARIGPGNFKHEELARPGVPITAGVLIEGGRLYFASGARLWSYELPE